MITCDTMDTAACVQADARSRRRRLPDRPHHRADGEGRGEPASTSSPSCARAAATCRIVADIHFKPDAAMEAAKWVEKVRINPGNYADSKKFAVKEYTDEQYAAEVEAHRGDASRRWCSSARRLGRAMRIGTNHGSLSDRIMNRYGDTPLGMVESALEFARIARKHDFHNFMFSMKSSNPKVMIEAIACSSRGSNRTGPDWNYPIHLGVTEAGDGEDGRIKSAIGIGSLLCDGLGDTIRVSLTEDCRARDPGRAGAGADSVASTACRGLRIAPDIAAAPRFDPFPFERRRHRDRLDVERREARRRANRPRRRHARDVGHGRAQDSPKLDDVKPEAVYEDSERRRSRSARRCRHRRLNAADPQLVTVKDGLDLAADHRLPPARRRSSMPRHPILLKDCSAFRRRSARAGLPALAAPRRHDHRLAARRRHRRRDSRARRSRRRPVAAARLQHSAGRRLPHLQDRLRRLPELRPHAVQSADRHRAHQAPPPAISRA